MNGENSKKAITFDEIALALAKDYECIYVINAVDDSYVEYITQGENKDLVLKSSGENFYKDTIRNCRILVYPDDQEFFLDTNMKCGDYLKNNGASVLKFVKYVVGEGIEKKEDNFAAEVAAMAK